MKRQPTPTNVLDELMSTTFSRENDLQLVRVALDRILDNPYQYRQHYDPAGIVELATNINALAWQLPETMGLQSPPMGRLVRVDAAGNVMPVIGANARTALVRDPQTRIQLAFGHRRLRAFQVLALGLPSVFPTATGLTAPTPSAEYALLPVTVAEIDDQGMAEYALTENSQREQVSAIEEAALLQRMMAEFELNLEQVGRKFGWSKSTVSNKLRLLGLPVPVRRAVLTGDLSEKAARTLLRLADAPDLLADLADKCRANNWSVRTLDGKITDAIHQLPAVPDATRAMWTPWGERAEQPAPWDMSWIPAGSPNNTVRGACVGCPMRIEFHGDDPYRCVDKACYAGKAAAWTLIRRQREMAAARAALDAQGLTGVPVVEYKADMHEFRHNGEEDKRLLEAGQCGPECACYAAIYYPGAWRPADLVRPAPDVAPAVCFGCTDKAHYERKLAPVRQQVNQERDQQTAAAEAERIATDPEYAKRVAKRAAGATAEKARQAQNDQQAAALIDGLIKRCGSAQDLLVTPAFLVELAAKLGNAWEAAKLRTQYNQLSGAEVVRVIIEKVVAVRENGLWDLAATQAACSRIAPLPAQPGPGESQHTHWEQGWDDADAAAYQDLMARWDGKWHHLPVLDMATPRCLLRLIETCPQRDIRGGLHRLYNEREVGI